MRMYEVGGCIRDELLGVPSHDIDFAVVLDDLEYNSLSGDSPFETMEFLLMDKGFELIEKARKPGFVTAKGKFPGTNQVVDFVLARKEGNYTDGRRPDFVEPGTLEDDLARRDFTMNAIAKAPDGSLIDPFNGRLDIERKLIRAVGDPFRRLTEDALRALRALRFAVTKDFTIESNLSFCLESAAVLSAIENNVSAERINYELQTMFRYDTLKSLNLLNRYPALTRSIFSGKISLDSTLKTKGRGK